MSGRCRYSFLIRPPEMSQSLIGFLLEGRSSTYGRFVIFPAILMERIDIWTERVLCPSREIGSRVMATHLAIVVCTLSLTVKLYFATRIGR